MTNLDNAVLLAAAKAVLEAYDELDMHLSSQHEETVDELRFAVSLFDGGAK